MTAGVFWGRLKERIVYWKKSFLCFLDAFWIRVYHFVLVNYSYKIVLVCSTISDKIFFHIQKTSESATLWCISYSLALLTYYSIRYSLTILFRAIRLLITHPILYIWQKFGHVLPVKRKENICSSVNANNSQNIWRPASLLKEILSKVFYYELCEAF